MNNAVVIVHNRWKRSTFDAGCTWVDDPWSRKYDIIVLHHVLEHMGCGEGDEMIQNCYDHLNGSLLVFVPDMKALAKLWVMGGITDQIYLTNVYGAYMGDDADRHKWGYTSEYLKAYLSRWNWKVKGFDWRPVQGADIARDWYIIGMEAMK